MNPIEFPFSLSLSFSLAITSRIEFNDLNPQIDCRFNLFWIGIDKKSHRNSRVEKRLKTASQDSRLFWDIQTTLCCELLTPFRNHGDQRGAMLNSPLNHLGCGSHLEV